MPVSLAVALAVTTLVSAGALQAHAFASTDYPMFGHDLTHSAVSPDKAVSVSHWPALTLKHTVSLGGFILASPVVFHNTNLAANVVYIATSGTPSFDAIDTATGSIIWSFPLGADVYDTAAVFGNTVYFGSEDHRLYALNATTGKLVCSFDTGGIIEASPAVANIDGTGPLVFFGDVGLSESHNAGHEWAINGVGNQNKRCTPRWSFNAWANTNGGHNTGSWSPPALGIDGTGRPLLVFGSSQPDDSVYALDARNGSQVWRFQTAVTGTDADVGAAPTISPPGLNGLSDGAVYVMGKDRHEYAINFLTGAPLWDFNLSTLQCSTDPISGTALAGAVVVFNFCKWIYIVEAAPTGPGTTTVVWRSHSTAHARASPTISGAAGDQVILRGDKAGNEDAFSLTGHTSLTPFFVGSTTTEIIASTAVSRGLAVFAGTDGNVYILG